MSNRRKGRGEKGRKEGRSRLLFPQQRDRKTKKILRSLREPSSRHFLTKRYVISNRRQQKFVPKADTEMGEK